MSLVFSPSWKCPVFSLFRSPTYPLTQFQQLHDSSWEHKRNHMTVFTISPSPSHFAAVQPLSHVQRSVTPWTEACRLPCPSLFLRGCSNSCPLSQWYYSAISSSASHFSFCLQFFPASGSFPISWLFASGGQSTGAFTVSKSLHLCQLLCFYYWVTSLCLTKASLSVMWGIPCNWLSSRR